MNPWIVQISIALLAGVTGGTLSYWRWLEDKDDLWIFLVSLCVGTSSTLIHSFSEPDIIWAVFALAIGAGTTMLTYNVIVQLRIRLYKKKEGNYKRKQS